MHSNQSIPIYFISAQSLQVTFSLRYSVNSKDSRIIQHALYVQIEALLCFNLSILDWKLSAKCRKKEARWERLCAVRTWDQKFRLFLILCATSVVYIARLSLSPIYLYPDSKSLSNRIMCAMVDFVRKRERLKRDVNTVLTVDSDGKTFKNKITW